MTIYEPMQHAIWAREAHRTLRGVLFDPGTMNMSTNLLVDWAWGIGYGNDALS